MSGRKESFNAMVGTDGVSDFGVVVLLSGSVIVVFHCFKRTSLFLIS